MFAYAGPYGKLTLTRHESLRAKNHVSFDYLTRRRASGRISAQQSQGAAKWLQNLSLPGH